MRPTTSAATPPAELSKPKPSAAAKRQAPLADVTNFLPLPETPAPTKPRRSARRPLPTASDSAVSSTCSSTASVTPAPKPSTTTVLEVEVELSVFRSPPISTVYARRRATDAEVSRSKGKAAASCSALGKATRTNRRKNSMAHSTRPISSSASCHGPKIKRPFSSTSKLPEDFVKKQRAYFADVDAFELPEEEVSESELE